MKLRIALVLAIVSVPALCMLVVVELRTEPVDTYWQANGPEYHQIDRGAFNRAVREGICRAASSVHAFPEQHETQHVCEL